MSPGAWMAGQRRPGRSGLIPWRPHPALPFPDFLPLGSRAAEGQSSEREETQTHGEVRREFTVADPRLNSLGEQWKPSGSLHKCVLGRTLWSWLLEIHHSVGFALWPTSAAGLVLGLGPPPTASSICLQEGGMLCRSQKDF
ncbi:unnamed protein product [Rangifer tarandus platyrhynchus]|uniref:Uncharacterized protein n=1 Tax=Rangifer tarandus platyrhynchus TaxID=3082113 RepID=A0ABN8ZUY0_RANTA|nr:unnamed protein product [Rangifer tarandus platyrhynchus]